MEALRSISEASGAIWKHFEVSGGAEGDSGGFENDFCLKVITFLSKSMKIFKKRRVYETLF